VKRKDDDAIVRKLLSCVSDPVAKLALSDRLEEVGRFREAKIIRSNKPFYVPPFSNTIRFDRREFWIFSVYHTIEGLTLAARSAFDRNILSNQHTFNFDYLVFITRNSMSSRFQESMIVDGFVSGSVRDYLGIMHNIVQPRTFCRISKYQACAFGYTLPKMLSSYMQLGQSTFSVQPIPFFGCFFLACTNQFQFRDWFGIIEDNSLIPVTDICEGSTSQLISIAMEARATI
jgi:hypothetical protein